MSAHPPTASPPLPGVPQAALIVEDNPPFAAQLVSALHQLSASIAVTVCATGGDALAQLARPQPFGLALIDLGLPDMDGTEVIRALHRHDPELPIMVVSVMARERAVIDAIRAGARGYILKSDPQQAVSAAIGDVLQGNYPISPALARFLFRMVGNTVAEAPSDPARGNSFGLSPRELETLRHLSRGNSYQDVAGLMGVTLSTIQANIRSLYRKLGVTSQVKALNKARENRLI